MRQADFGVQPVAQNWDPFAHIYLFIRLWSG